MYLRRSTRIFSLVLIGLSLFCLGPLVIWSWTQPGLGHGRVVGTILAFLPLGLGTPYLLFLCLPAARLRLQRDVLRSDLHIDTPGEIRNVQFVSMLLPDHAPRGGTVVFAVFLQNAHLRPSRVTVEFKRSRLLPARSIVPIELRGGEVWCVAVPVTVPTEAPDGEVAIGYRLRVQHPEGIGPRTIQKEGLSRSKSRQMLDDVVTVTDGPAPPPDPTGIPDGAWRLFGPDDREPDLSPVNVVLRMA
jgi:hypothetical protein